MDTLFDFLNWAWARHHNPISWYIRPLFVLPFCDFSYHLCVLADTTSVRRFANRIGRAAFGLGYAGTIESTLRN